MERPLHALTFLGNLEGVAEDELAGGDGAVGLALVVDVEVACKDGRLVAYDAPYAVDDEECSLAAGLGTNVVEVGVHGHEDTAGLALAQFCPSGNAAACAVPSDESHGIRILREPEGVAAEEFEAVFPIEYRGRFTGTVAIVAANADVSVIGKAFLQVGELVIEHFLATHHVEVVVPDEGCHGVLAVLPVVQTVLRIVVTDVEGGTVEGKGGSLFVGAGGKCPCAQGDDGEENMFVHGIRSLKLSQVNL